MSRLNQDLGLWQGVGLLTTSLLGTGIFIVPATAAALAGATSLWAWPLLTLLVLPVAFTFAQLGRRFPHAGGAPSLIGRAFGPALEQAVAFLFLLVIPVGLPAALKMTSGFWHAVYPLSAMQELGIQLATLGLMLWLGQRPARASGQVQTGIALLILATVGAVWWRGGLFAGADLMPPVATLEPLHIPAALGVMFWCFVGLEAFTHMGEEFRRPGRDFPLALLLGVLLAGLVYWACAVAVVHFGVYGDERTNGASLPALVALLWGDGLRWLAALVGYLACFASINIYVQGFARLVWSLADEGKLPAVLAARNRHGVPGLALRLVVGVCALSAVLAWWQSVSIESLIRYANGIFVSVYLLSMMAGVVLLRGIWRVLALLASLLSALVVWALGAEMLYAVAALAIALGLSLLRRIKLTGSLPRT